MEYRSVVVRGEYDHSQQVLLKNQPTTTRLDITCSRR
jgi:cytochrome oxidase assembly protein ShyY1